MQSVDEFNDRFGLADALAFRTHADGGIVVDILTPTVRAAISLKGAQLLQWQPAGQEPMLWLSPLSNLGDEKPIRGGVPVCWPWFADHASDPTKPAHGTVRTKMWQPVASAIEADGSISLTLRAPEQSAAPAHLELCLTIVAGEHLELALSTRNDGAAPITITQALHTYFHVGDCRATRVEGLDGLTYLDKVAAFARKSQQGDVVFEGEVDRIYLGVARAVLNDPVLARRLVIDSRGTSRSTIVWNPGPERARRIVDMPDEGYRTMVCVETGNAADDAITIAPGGVSRLVQRVSVEPLLA